MSCKDDLCTLILLEMCYFANCCQRAGKNVLNALRGQCECTIEVALCLLLP